MLVDGAPRVACVTPARRVAGRSVVTAAGLPADEREAWAEAFCATGASQCGFCTPGIVVRLAALKRKGGTDVDGALLAHLCRCTGWRTIAEAYDAFEFCAANSIEHPPRDLAAASSRATIEGGVSQRVGPEIALGGGGFADDTAPLDSLVAVPDGGGGWVVGETVAEARGVAGKVQGRRTTVAVRHPIDIPPGAWDVTLRTTWVEPAYLEPDASWCAPGGEPVTPLANGGAFGGKAGSIASEIARRLAREHGRTVRVLLSREDVVRLGPKRPPIAAGAHADGTGVLRVARTPGIAEAIAAHASALVIEEVDVAGPPVSSALRGAGWAEAMVLLTGARGATAPVTTPKGGVAEAEVTPDGIHVRVDCGEPLDDVVLRSYCIGAAHMGLGWVTSEAIAVDDEGIPHDLTIRSFGVVRARDMIPVDVEIVRSSRAPVNGSDAVFVAVAAAAWIGQGCPQDWPTQRTGAPT